VKATLKPLGQRRALSASQHRDRFLAGATGPGEFGIFVPRRRLTPISAQWLDLIVVPLVGVDGAGRRLGLRAGTHVRLDSLATESEVEHYL